MTLLISNKGVYMSETNKKLKSDITYRDWIRQIKLKYKGVSI
jgi:hypothetical protein